MVTARLLLVAVHALLHDRPVAIVGNEETMQIKIEPVLNGCAVDFGDETACARQPSGVEANALAYHAKFVRGLSGMLPAPTADMNAEFV